MPERDDRPMLEPPANRAEALARSPLTAPASVDAAAGVFWSWWHRLRARAEARGGPKPDTGYTGMRWHTIHDDRVRPAHLAQNEKIWVVPPLSGPAFVIGEPRRHVPVTPPLKIEFEGPCPTAGLDPEGADIRCPGVMRLAEPCACASVPKPPCYACSSGDLACDVCGFTSLGSDR